MTASQPAGVPQSSPRRRRRGMASRARALPSPADDDGFEVPGWWDFGGSRLFVVGLTSGGFPFGALEEDELGEPRRSADAEPF